MAPKWNIDWINLDRNTDCYILPMTDSVEAMIIA